MFTYSASTGGEGVWSIYATFDSSDATHSDSDSLDSPQSLTIYTPTTTTLTCTYDDISYAGLFDLTACTVRVTNADTGYDYAPTGTLTISGGPSDFPTTCALTEVGTVGNPLNIASGCYFTYTAKSGDAGVYSIHASFVSDDTTQTRSDSTHSPQPLTITGGALSCGSVIITNTTLSADIGPCFSNAFVSSSGLIIGANNIVLNCAGHTIIGSPSDYAAEGVNLTGRTGVTIENCNIVEFIRGFNLYASSGNTLTKNNATESNGGAGFSLWSSSNDVLTMNTVCNATHGFELFNSSNNILSANFVNFTQIGFDIEDSNSNAFTTNAEILGLDGFYLDNSNSNTFTGNSANNNTFGFNIEASSNNKLTGNTADFNIGAGFFLFGSNSNTLTMNAADKNMGGFSLSSSSNNELAGNTASGNSPDYGDDSKGSGTAGTANFYSNNTCTPTGSSSPAGLC